MTKILHGIRQFNFVMLEKDATHGLSFSCATPFRRTCWTLLGAKINRHPLIYNDSLSIQRQSVNVLYNGRNRGFYEHSGARQGVWIEKSLQVNKAMCFRTYICIGNTWYKKGDCWPDVELTNRPPPTLAMRELKKPTCFTLQLFIKTTSYLL